ncbi:DUF4347 domain-containing protein, partial [Neptunomonas sp.]|uniref:DUF4347 domain-containing protein n=1 Tax=Neptunomonas sp. TaxID=1971898 RepID=UPI00356698A5
MKKPASRRKQAYATPIFEGLEPRILLSADLPGLDVLTHDSHAESESSVSSILSNAESEAARINSERVKADNTDEKNTLDNTNVADKSFVEDIFLVSPDAPPALSYELAFIDSTVPDYQQLIDDLQLQSTDTRIIDVVILDANRSGIEQISDTLSSYSNLNAIHIISHGADGAVDLGNTQLNNQSLAEHSEQLQAWGASLDGEADILFYGCDLTATAEGRALIDQIADLTGADIAASDDLTGSAELGGDWDLEYQTGKLEANVAFSLQAQTNWS